MNKSDKIFLTLLIVSSMLLAATVAENIRSVLNPQPVTIKIDVAKVKADIEKAGLVPHEAMYGKEL